MTILRWTFAIVLLGLSGLLATYNAGVAFRLYVMRREAPSWIPLVGGIAGLLGVLCLPLRGSANWWWVPLIVDWGTIPGTVFAVLFHLAHFRAIYRRRYEEQELPD